MNTKTIAVIGATGLQGSGVVNALVKDGTFRVRALTRHPENYAGEANEVMKADLSDLDSLKTAFEGAHGVFVVTNFMEGADEYAQGKLAIEAAKHVGVKHFIWSTLPNIEAISGGKFDAPNFSGKAKLDERVKQAGFDHISFVQAPFYFQNLTGMMAAQPQQDGTEGWALPIDPTKKVIHMGDISDLGKIVAGAFLHPERAGNGQYLSLATGLFSFNDIVETFATVGKHYTFTEVPKELFATFFEGASVITETFGYFEAHTYMGPDSQGRIQLANEIATEHLNTFSEWLKQQD